MNNERVNNILFAIRKIKCELVFINKAKHIEQCELFKILLNKEYNCVTVDVKKLHQVNESNNDNKSNDQCITKTFYLLFNEKEEVNEDNSSMLIGHITFTLFVSFEEHEKNEGFISIYQKNIALIGDQLKRNLCHLIIFTEDKIASHNTDDHIHYCKNSNEEIKQTVSHLINRILSDNYTQVMSQPNLLTPNGSLINREVMEVKERCEEYIQIGLYETPSRCFPLLFEMIKIPTEQIKFKECQVMTMVFIDYFSNINIPTALSFNTEIEKIFDEVFSGYTKAKQQLLLVESYLRLGCYYSLFKDKIRDCLDIIQKAYIECIGFLPKKKMKILLHCYMILSELGYKRKGCLYLYLAIAACYECPQDLLNVIPYLFKEMNKTFAIYDISNNFIESYELFNAIHEEICVNKWKRISFTEGLRDKDKSKNNSNVNINDRTSKKRIEKDYYLKVINNFEQYDYLLPGVSNMLEIKWPPILYNIYLNLVTYYKEINNTKLTIANTLCLLQFLRGFLSQNEQSNLIKDLLKYSSTLQEKFYLNLPYMPILIKINPIAGSIKLEKKNKFVIDTNKQNVFLYNPWGKEGVNYFWTVNSFQTISIELFNPLSIPLSISGISILFEGQVPFSFPTSAIIDSNSFKEIVFKIRPLQEGLISIKGLIYEIENITGMQFVDENGNGMLYKTTNSSQDPYTISNHKKELLMLNDIQIYPEIPILQIKVLDDSNKLALNAQLDLYEYQFYSFSLLLENISVYPIESIEIAIYVYKKDDYKVLLDEINLTNSNCNDCLIPSMSNYVFDYHYIHRKKHRRIEMRFYYKFNSEMYETMTMRPFCYYSRQLASKKLFHFDSIKTAPMISNNTIRDLIKNDPRIKQTYWFCFSTRRFYISFNAKIANNNNMTISYDLTYKENLIKKGSISSLQSTEIALVAKDVTHLNEAELNWSSTNEAESIEGKIDLFKLVINELEYKFYDGIIFDIKLKEKTNEEGLKHLEMTYCINNKTKTNYSMLRFYIYLYQTNEGLLLFNNHLNPDVLYDGSLFYLIKELKPSDDIEYSLLLYLPIGEIINTTCVLIDDLHKIIYIPTIVKRCFIQYN